MSTDNDPIALPTLWLLGKTGAGKSSIVRYLTGDESITIGNGFRPCTQTSQAYDFPIDRPWVRFVDTRGLGEADYDPDEDLTFCQLQSHALLICARLDDPEQRDLLAAIKKIKKKISNKSVILIHTASESLDNLDEKKRVLHHQQDQFEQAWGAPLDFVLMDVADHKSPVGGEKLQEWLSKILPEAAQLSEKLHLRQQEVQQFEQHKSTIKRYATAAAATDTLPGIGLVTVPAIQAALLRHLAKQYQITWRRKDLSAFIGTLGTGFGIQYASHLGIRQLIKLLPVYGQTIGSAGAAAVSFATTYAIGRVACLYLFHQQHHNAASADELKQAYQQTFTLLLQDKRHEKTE